ncbi:unnamed protein product [Brachionus calyciflorus]|uniref:Uncharacterized protein n=1 Tax=Brachionus calyciflorus TaxID=104777 RepID=A0A814H3G2_9BILA|nr:unnamed protein product [Brachionus calyciflorus]
MSDNDSIYSTGSEDESSQIRKSQKSSSKSSPSTSKSPKRDKPAKSNISVPNDFDVNQFLDPRSHKRNSSTCFCFVITGIQRETDLKQKLFEILEPLSYELAVGEEPNLEKDKIHFHVFMRSILAESTKTLIWQIYDGLKSNFMVYLEKTKDPKNQKKYAVKFDKKPLTKNFKYSNLGIPAKAEIICKEKESLDFSDPRLLAEPSLMKACVKAHDSIREKNFQMMPLLPIRYVKEKFMDFRDDFIEWLNSYISEGWFYKRPQAYIWVEPGVGKTSGVNMLLHPWLSFRFSPMRDASNRFQWSGWKASMKNHVVIDEFKPGDFNPSKLNLLLAGDILSVDQKFKGQNDAYMRCPIIIISNFPPDITMPGFKERVKVFHVTSRGTKIKDIKNWIYYDEEVKRLPLLYTRHKPVLGSVKVKPLKFLNEILADVREHDVEVDHENQSDPHSEHETWSDDDEAVSRVIKQEDPILKIQKLRSDFNQILNRFDGQNKKIEVEFLNELKSLSTSLTIFLEKQEVNVNSLETNDLFSTKEKTIVSTANSNKKDGLETEQSDSESLEPKKQIKVLKTTSSRIEILKSIFSPGQINTILNKDLDNTKIIDYVSKETDLSKENINNEINKSSCANVPISSSEIDDVAGSDQLEKKIENFVNENIVTEKTKCVENIRNETDNQIDIISEINSEESRSRSSKKLKTTTVQRRRSPRNLSNE